MLQSLEFLAISILLALCVFQCTVASSSESTSAFDEQHFDSAVIRQLQESPPISHNPHELPWHHGHHFNHTGGHKKAWMHFKEVDGLKNEEVAVFVMSSTTNEGMLLRER
jgi:hypothetical protein